MGYADKQKHFKKEIATINEREHELKLKEVEQKNELKSYEASETEKRAYIRGLDAKVHAIKILNNHYY